MSFIAKIGIIYNNADDFLDQATNGLHDILIAAGWVVRKDFSGASGNQDRIYFSDGEDSTERLFLRVSRHETVSPSGPSANPVLANAIAFRQYTFWDSAVQPAGAPSTLTVQIVNADVMAGAGVITLASATNYPTSGVVIIRSELFFYTGKTATTLTGVTRAAFGSVNPGTTHAVGQFVVTTGFNELNTVTTAGAQASVYGLQSTPFVGWIVANKNHVAHIARIGTTYKSGYHGLLERMVPTQRSGRTTTATSPVFPSGTSTQTFDVGSSTNLQVGQRVWLIAQDMSLNGGNMLRGSVTTIPSPTSLSVQATTTTPGRTFPIGSLVGREPIPTFERGFAQVFESSLFIAGFRGYTALSFYDVGGTTIERLGVAIGIGTNDNRLISHRPLFMPDDTPQFSNTGFGTLAFPATWNTQANANAGIVQVYDALMDSADPDGDGTVAIASIPYVTANRVGIKGVNRRIVQAPGSFSSAIANEDRFIDGASEYMAYIDLDVTTGLAKHWAALKLTT